MEVKNIHKSKTVRGIVIGLGVAILILVIFQLGMVAGYHKAKFSERMGDNFSRNFIDPRRNGFEKEFSSKGLPPGGHGAVGKIVSISLPTLIVAEPNNLEKTVLISGGTEIREFRNKVNKDDLKVGSSIVVLGIPNNEGQVEAKLIRVMPSQMNMSATTTSIK